MPRSSEARRLTAVASFLLALGGCARTDGRGVPATPPADAAVAAADSASSAEAGAAAVENSEVLSWQDLVRAERWADAEAALSKTPAEEQSKPEVRFARARVLAKLGKHSGAVALLQGLEETLPLLREALAKARAESALHAGPLEIGAEWFGAKGGIEGLVIACETWEKAGDAARAASVCERAIHAEKRTRAQEERARAVRLRLTRTKEGDAKAEPDARWLAASALDDAHARAGSEVLEKLGKPLTGEELLARSRTLADAMRSDDALRAVERAGSAKGKTAPADLCRARAEAFFKAKTRYPEAALAYRQCANAGGPSAAENAFLAARSLSRADRDTEALAGFQSVLQKFPTTPWAEQARFHVARSHALAGRAREAAHAFDEYVKLHPKGHDRREADRYRALSHLAAGEWRVARKLLEELAGGERDTQASARWTNLAALAALHDGDRLHAVARWSEVAKSEPLSWAALVARARLAAASAPYPDAIAPPESGSPEPLAVELPPPVDVLHRIGLDGDAEEALREREGVVVSRSGGRGTEALCAAYGMLDRAKRRYRIALQIPASLLATAPGPRNRWAWECAYPRPHRFHVRRQEDRAKVPANLLWAVMRQESAFDSEAVSPARAVGLLQLLPETAKTVASQASLPHDDTLLTSPAQNIALGALYLAEVLGKLDHATPLAVGAYNAGPDPIQRWLTRAKGSTMDVFVEAIPFVETRGYVVRVMGNVARYEYLERGEAGVPRLALELP